MKKLIEQLEGDNAAAKKDALIALKGLAEAGNLEAQWTLGCEYDFGEYIRRNRREAEYWYSLAAQQDCPRSMVNLALLLKEKRTLSVGEKRRIIALNKRAGELGNSNGFYNLALAYKSSRGHLVRRDPRKSIELLRRAVALGSNTALRSLAYMYLDGNGVKAGKEKFHELMLRAANQGDLEAIFQTGINFHRGRGVMRDFKKALVFFKRASRMDYDKALLQVGYMNFHGEGVRENEKEGLKWYRRAAELGSRSANYNLGLCYLYGTGTRKNKATGLKFLRLAAEKGHVKAKKLLREESPSGKSLREYQRTS